MATKNINLSKFKQSNMKENEKNVFFQNIPKTWDCLNDDYKNILRSLNISPQDYNVGVMK
jgi:hypothetical protein